MQLQQHQNVLNMTMPSYNMIFEAKERFGEHRESLRSGEKSDFQIREAIDIEVRNVAKRYGDNQVLHDVSLSIPAGQIVGLVGPSGAGKSTLVDMIIGLVSPSEGDIVVGGVPLRDINLAAWRQKVGYVPQDTFLFHDTILNNIRWSMPDAPVSAAKAAAEAAGLNTFIESLPSGYDTIVGDRGAKLSGGQRQRMSIARALLRQPVLLILDEATSALDSLSEQEIMNVIHRLCGKMTILIVAHRLATVKEADLICVFDHGHLVEQGTWSGLIKRKALFHRLMQAQTITEGE